MNHAALLPREHGAYAQMALPLVTATAVAGPSLLAVAVVAGFLAHEPLLVLLGQRGPRARREHGAHAAWWLGALVLLGAAAAALALFQTPSADRWTFLLPLGPVAVMARETLRGSPKSLAAEGAAAAAFALATVPLATSAGAAVGAGMSVALPFFVVFEAATLAVRSITQRSGGGSGPRAAAQARAGAVVVALAGCAGLGWAAAAAAVPWAAVSATVPGAAVAAGIALAPPHARHVRGMGWLVAGASLAAGVLLATAG